MTNFEWLVKTDGLENFIYSVGVYFINNKLQNEIETKYEGLVITWGDSISEKCANWLTSEHKTTKYVALDEVLNLFNRPMKVDSLKSKFSDTEVYHLIAENCCDIKDAILNLETKEIDE